MMKKFKIGVRDTKHLKDGIAKYLKASEAASPAELSQINLWGDGCGLCRKYWSYRKQPCSGCPIQKFTGEPGCEATPYYRKITGFSHLINHQSDDYQAGLGQISDQFDRMNALQRKQFRKQCKDMAAFLQRVLDSAVDSPPQ